MKAKKFKTLCRRILNLEANGWKAEMPDDWKIMVFTRHGIEPLDSWMDEVDNKQILLCGKSVNEEPIWHKVSEDDLPYDRASIALYHDGALYTGEYRPNPVPLGELYDGDCNWFSLGDKWCYLKDILPKDD